MDDTPVVITEGNRSSSNTPKFILLGGFLGAGKTTCMSALARWLTDRGMRCGLITNDQADGLVDTALAMAAAQNGLAEAVRQVTGGCFCCQANELGKALQELDEAVRPDVFIAEPVGSCTDLVATVLLPLKNIYQQDLIPAPMSVVVDSRRLHDMLLGKARKIEKVGFSRDVRYIYLKQLEEAEIIVLNKIDLLNSADLNRLLKKLHVDWPSKKIIVVSARTGEGLDEWFSLLVTETRAELEGLREIDYDRYGKGEALLGWFNARLRFNEGRWEVDGNALLEGLIQNIQKKLEDNGIEIAHFKMSLRTSKGELGVANAVRSGSPGEISRLMNERVKDGEILINLRAEGAPAILKKIVISEIKDLPLTIEEITAFKPGKPVPVHRITVGTNEPSKEKAAKLS